MKTWFLFAAITLLIGFGPSAGDHGDSKGSKLQDVTGQVTLRNAKSEEPIKDASGVVIWLVPSSGARPSDPDPKAAKFRMVQRNKRFEPALLVVPLGSYVVFPNFDPWYHSVFSLYRGKRFDLGLYESGSEKEVKFDRPGPSFIFCNIHPEMSAIILTVDSDFWGVSDKSGHVSISNVPDGNYLLRVWYQGATEQTLAGLDRRVEIGAEDHNLPPLAIDAVPQKPAGHKNKYGKDYDPAMWPAVY